MDEDLKRKNFDKNIEILRTCVDLYDIGFDKRWKDTISAVDFVEYSNSDIRNPFGYYEESVWYELVTINYMKGKLFKNQPKKYNFKYYFNKDGELLITEKYLTKHELPEVHFHIYGLREKTILIYENISDWVLCGVVHTSRDVNGRITQFIRGLTINTRFVYIEVHKYFYNSTEMQVKRASYSENSNLYEDDLIWDYSTFPIEWLSGKPGKNYRKISIEKLKQEFKERIETILLKIDKKDPYSIMFIFDGPATMSIDYAIESTANKNKNSEERWNYACWVQHPIPIWNTQNEKKQFISWLENETLDSELGVSLVDNQHFIELFYQIFDDLKGSVSLSNLFQRVTFLVTDFEIHDRIVAINLKLNQTENLKDFLSWINTIEDKMP